MILDFSDPGFDPDVIFRSVVKFQLDNAVAPFAYNPWCYISTAVFDVWSMMVLFPDSDVWFANGVDMRFYQFTISGHEQCEVAASAIEFRRGIIRVLVLGGFVDDIGGCDDRLYPILVNL